jgi:hypothetical protein
MYNWSPGSWDNISIAQLSRLIERANEMAEERRSHTESVTTVE